MLLKNLHLANTETIAFVKQLCESVDSNEDIKWRFILTKPFEFELPGFIMHHSLQVSFDILDIMAHNSIEKNKKINLETSLVKEETLVFNCKIFFQIDFLFKND